ncbi:MAG: CDP-4-dehydro-6-deoxyglucose reductase [Parasphingorhabdus sp.]|jgi:CDP-4-dehydro-6-deoxyglucose reductase
MSFRIKIKDTDYEFENHGSESLLDSALNAGIPVSYGCSNGNCGDCAGWLKSGELRQLRHSDHVFASSEKAKGRFLLCTHSANSDLQIEAATAGGSEEIPLQEIAVKVRKVNQINEQVATLDVQTPRTHRLRFLAGQWAEVSDGKQFAFRLPIASCPCDDRNLQFHLPLQTDECLSASQLLSSSKGMTLTLQGPYGDFVLNQNSTRPRLMIGSAFGFPPLKSIIEHSLSLTPEIPIDLVWLEQPEQIHYMDNHMRMWDDALDNFTLHRIQCVAMSGQSPAPETMELMTGFFRQDRDIYVAGPVELSELVNEMIESFNLSTENFHRCVV